jgi:hypothetical protein
MAPELSAYVFRQLIVDIGGQLPKNVETPFLAMLVRVFPGHEPAALGRQSPWD